MKIQEELVTPDMAKKWLENNESNRSISKMTVDHYARMMRRGEWGSCPQPIVLNGSALLDGQHRLSALVKHGKPVRFFVCRGADREVRTRIDQGKIRTCADILKMEHGITSAARLAAVARWIERLQNGTRMKLTPMEVLEIRKRHASGFDWMDTTQGRGGRFFRGAFILAPLVWAHRIDPVATDSFYEGLHTGEGLTRNSPELRLRNHIMAMTSTAGEQPRLVLMVLTALKAKMDGKEVKSLRAGADAYHAMRRAMRLSKKGGKWADEVVRNCATRRRA